MQSALAQSLPHEPRLQNLSSLKAAELKIFADAWVNQKEVGEKEQFDLAYNWYRLIDYFA